MKHIDVEDEVHRRLDVWKAACGLRNFSDAVADLLARAENQKK